MVHELMHIIGVNHVQKRPDAIAPIHLIGGETKGPFIKVHWEHITAKWVSQWSPASSSYVGSVTTSYVPYDYGSIMHYGHGNYTFDTVDGTFTSASGNRVAMTAGDILQLNDMYQCSTYVDASADASADARADRRRGLD